MDTGKKRGLVMEIKNVKLVTGEELVSEAEHTNVDNKAPPGKLRPAIKLTNPLIVFVTEKGLAFMRWAVLTHNETVTLDMNHVLYVEDVKDEIENKYREQVGNIVVVKQPAIKLEI